MTTITLTVENPKPSTRYYVVAEEVIYEYEYEESETLSSSENEVQVQAKQVRNTQPQCSVRSCSKFCKRGAKLCGSCDKKATQEKERIAMERNDRNVHPAWQMWNQPS